MSFLDDAISTIGQGLAQTAVQAVSNETGFDVGGTLNLLFGDGQTKGGQNLLSLQDVLNGLGSGWGGSAEQLEMLQSTLGHELDLLQGIGAQLNAISSELATIQGEIANIEELLQEIKQEQLYQDWSSANQNVVNYLTAITTNFGNYGLYTSNYKHTAPALVVSLTNSILDGNVGPLVGMSRINSAILDGTYQKGLLQLWANMVTPLITQGIVDYRNAIDQYLQYYQKLAYGQLQAACLVMEAYTFEDSLGLVASIWNQYKQCLLSQESVVMTWLYQLLAAGANTYQAYNVDPQAPKSLVLPWTSSTGALDLNPALQGLWGASAKSPESYYTPSAIVKSAESLLANLSVTGPTDRRIVVHMVYNSSLDIGGHISAINLTLLSPTGNNVLGHAQTLSESTFQNMADTNFFPFPGNFTVRRFLFSDTSGLQDGAYTLTNLNGQMEAIETYLSTYAGSDSAICEFQSDNVLAYTLQIGGASPFDFMNFVPYSLPTFGISDRMHVPGLAAEVGIR